MSNKQKLEHEYDIKGLLFEDYKDLIIDTENNTIKIWRTKDIKDLSSLIEHISGSYVFYNHFINDFKKVLNQSFFTDVCLANPIKYVYPIFSELDRALTNMDRIEESKWNGKPFRERRELKLNSKKTQNDNYKKKVFDMLWKELYSMETDINTFILISLLKIFRVHIPEITEEQLFYIYLYLNDRTRNDKFNIKQKKRLLRILYKISDRSSIGYMVQHGILIYDFIWPIRKRTDQHKVLNNKIVVKRKSKRDVWYTQVTWIIPAKIHTHIPIDTNNYYILIVDVWNNIYLIDILNLRIIRWYKYHKIYHNI